MIYTINKIKQYTFLIFFLVISTTVSAQKDDEDRNERMKSLKIAFITEQLSLTPTEAQNFWPVYNKYDEKMEALHKDERTKMRSISENIESISEKDAAIVLSDHQKYYAEMEYLKQNKIKELSKFLSAKKTLKLLKAESDFKRQLIRKLRGGNHKDHD